MEQQSIVKPRRRLSTTSIVAIVALLIAIATVAELEVYYHSTRLYFSEVGSDLQYLHGHDQILSANVKILQTQATQSQQQMANLQQLNSGNHRAWVFEEVNYLVRLAHYNVTYTHDVPAAIVLLQTADQRIAALDDPAFDGLRQQFASSIGALQAIPNLDLAGLLSRINALAEQSKQLPLSAPASFIPQHITPAQQEQNAALPAWRKALQKSLNTLQTLVIIRHRNQPIAPLLAPEQEFYLQQNVQLFLQQAQWAALHGQENVYKVSLQQVEAWVQQYFAQDAANTRAFRHELDLLEKINVQPTLPGLNDLVRAVEQTGTHFTQKAAN